MAILEDLLSADATIQRRLHFHTNFMEKLEEHLHRIIVSVTIRIEPDYTFG